MVQLGRQIATKLSPGSVVYLNGELGAGKTTLVRGILQGFGHTGPVTSPTFTLVESYSLACCQLYHFDLYRLQTAIELESIGIRDMIGADTIVIFEWPERGLGVLPRANVEIDITYAPVGRLVHIPSSLLNPNASELAATSGVGQ